jgi:capsid protein
MSLQTKIEDVLTRIGTEFKTVYTKTGTLTNLTTTNKNNLVAAINELKGLLDSAAIINDAVSATTSTYSSDKIIALIASAKSEILGGASSAFDTLLEIQNALSSDDSDISGILTSLGNRVRFDAAQTLSNGEKTQALSNIGAIASSDIGDTNTNFVTVFEAALV